MKKCLYCNLLFKPDIGKRSYCSKTCYNALYRDKNPDYWKKYKSPKESYKYEIDDGMKADRNAFDYWQA